ncbi:MAG TPA: sodium:solute symporter, partial [Blastocatellia bacterium]|nr:sodium:solute symporter [Blastocatellia bacterium]
MQLHLLDIGIIAAYLAGITIFGWYSGRDQKDIRDYFLGDRDVPWWAITFSIVATETSSATFVSIPGIAFAGNMTFLQLVFGYMIGRLAIVLIFIPLYFRGDLLTAYQALDRRFGPRAKRSAAALFLITRSLSDGLRLLLTAIVLGELTGWSYPVSIIITGAATIIYTYFGGMKAVIWTDVSQLFIYILGALVAGYILLDRIPGGWGEFVAAGQAAGKFQAFDFTLDPSKAYTFWAGLIGGAFLTTSTHGTDQLMVQRYLCAKSARQAKAALLASGAIILAQFVLFLMIGIGLYVFYARFPSGADFSRTDRVFPFFIINELPAGVVGLVIASIFAAAMSTLSSSLNSSASTSLADFYRPLLKPDASDEHYLKVSRRMTALWGVAQIAVGISGAGAGESIVNQVLGIAAFTNGPILGIFLLAALTRRVSEDGALIGLALGVIFMLGVQFALPRMTGLQIAWPWFVLIGSTVTFACGLAAALFRRAGGE